MQAQGLLGNLPERSPEAEFVFWGTWLRDNGAAEENRKWIYSGRPGPGSEARRSGGGVPPVGAPPGRSGRVTRLMAPIEINKG